MNSKAILLLCLAAVSCSNARQQSFSSFNRPSRPSYNAPPQPSYQPPQPSYGAPQGSYEDSSEEKKGEPYEFGYEVQDHYRGVDFGHNSESDGNVVTGEYRVLLPDGRTQIVTYTADHFNGYQAEVSYEGEAQFPEPQQYSQPQPQYQQPQRNQYQQPPRNQYQPPTQAPTYG